MTEKEVYLIINEDGQYKSVVFNRVFLASTKTG